MKTVTKTKKKINIEKQEERFEKAAWDYKRLQQEIAPFIRKRKVEVHSTTGQWRESSHFYSPQEMDTASVLE